MEWTRRHNVNRGYMRLEVWNDAMELFKLTWTSVNRAEKVDLKLKSQIFNSVQSISANIAEGYCRKSVKEYLQFLYIALGSTGEALTRMIGLMQCGILPNQAFEEFDILHYAVENKLLALVKSLQTKAKTKEWNEEIANARSSHSG